MTRSQFQPGPALDHYHNVLGPNLDSGFVNGLVLQQVGPLPIAFDDDGINGSGVIVANVESGSTVLMTWLEITDEWDFADANALDIQVAPASDPSNVWQSTRYVADPSGHHISAQGDAGVVVEPTSGDGSAALKRYVVRVDVDSVISIRATDAPSAGAANVYAIIATPA